MTTSGGGEFSNTQKSTAIYLFENKCQTKERVCATIGCDIHTLNSWLDDKEVILEEVKAELTAHYLSSFTGC
jgi:hypothetical protein